MARDPEPGAIPSQDAGGSQWARLRQRFTLPAGTIYLDGNSLGALQPTVAARVARAVEQQWGQQLIRAWNPGGGMGSDPGGGMGSDPGGGMGSDPGGGMGSDPGGGMGSDPGGGMGSDPGWVELPRRIATRLAPLVGAQPDEVAVADSTSTDLFKVLVALAQLRPERRVLLTDDANFPTDVYVAQGVAELLGLEVRAAPADRLADSLDDDVAVLLLTEVDYRTGRRHDAAALTAAAHQHGALALWDLSHSTGALHVDLAGWDADAAVGCTYKYLCGGPGAPAYLFVARRHHDRVHTPIRGWFGHASPFAFDAEYVAAAGAERFQNGTPPVLSMVALDAALEIFEDLDTRALEARAATLTSRFIEEVDARCAGLGVEVVSPRDPAHRGAQVALRCEHAYAVMSALIARGVVGDHRPPDLLRFGFAPLYVTDTDVRDAVAILRHVLVTRAWDAPEHHRPRPVI